MNIIFWQKNLSIHQSAFLRALAEKEQVTLVVAEEFNNSRKVQGWHKPDFGQTQIIVGPSDQDIQTLINNDPNAIHIFSGFFGVPLIRFAYIVVFKLGFKAVFFLEPFDREGIKGMLRYLKYSLFIKRHKSKIKALLVTGEKAKFLYQKCGMLENKVFSWAYFTESPDLAPVEKSKPKFDTLPELCYVGQFIPRKNIIYLIEALKGLEGLFHKVTFIGGGELQNELTEMSRQYTWLEVMPFVPNAELNKEVASRDLLVLPSKFDGWGAVVNEALQAGTPVIASENCGSASLLDGEFRGEVFYFSNKNNLEAVLRKWLAKGKVSYEKRETIRCWSEKTISGESAATYFSKIIDYQNGKNMKRPLAPWVSYK
ncbi:MAG: glycosyltransferase family 4 protein [Bacteroidota bacterium]